MSVLDWLLKPKVLRRLIVVIVVLIALTVIAGALVLFEGRAVRREHILASMHLQTERLSRRFDSFFEPVLLDLQVLRDMGRRGVFDIDAGEDIKNVVLPILGKYPGKLSGFMLADAAGREFKLIRFKGKWERVESDYDPRDRPWFAGAVEAGKSDEIYWTPLYTFLTKRRLGVSISVAFSQSEETEPSVVALDILLDDYLEFVNALEISPRSRLLLVQGERVANFSRLTAEDLQDVGVPSASAGTLADPVIQATLEAWKKKRRVVSEAFAVTSEGGRWWAEFIGFDYGSKGGMVALIMPEKYLASKVSNLKLTVVGSTFCVLALAILVAALAYSGQLRAIEAMLNRPGHVGDSADELLAAIHTGESESLEFKSTLRWNLKANRPGKEIELAVLKTVAAFMNSEGGTLIVGLADDGSIAGIEADRFPDEDRFLLHFNNLIKQHIGLEFSKYISFSIIAVEDKSLFVVDCRRAEAPVYVRHGDDEDFYVRVGPGTRKLPMSAAMQYLAKGREELLCAV
ncbi:MAG: RNA-binding domain-containing protein [Planctomycetota bacterium]|jgi:hypothetical protein